MKKIIMIAIATIATFFIASGCKDATPRDTITSFYEAIFEDINANGNHCSAKVRLTDDFSYMINGKKVLDKEMIEEYCDYLNKYKPADVKNDYKDESDFEIREAKRQVYEQQKKVYELENKRYQNEKEKIAAKLKTQFHITDSEHLAAAKKAASGAVYTEQDGISTTTYTYSVNGKKYTEKVTISHSDVWKIKSIDVTIE